MDQKLRRLADYLLSNRSAADFNPAAVDADALPHLFVLEIEPEVEAVRLRIRLVGTALDAAFGRPLKGCHLEEFIHGPRGADVVEGFHHCATTREAIWMKQVVRIRDHLPRFVEGVAVNLKPDRIYGGLIVGELPADVEEGSFESYPLY
ncbi:MAG: hypothetical protein ABL996_17090 [Micropepsaceae bacterium]